MIIFNKLIAVIQNSFVSTTPPSDYFTTLVAGTVTDTGYYEGFPQPFQDSTGVIFSAFKRSAGHVDKGPLVIKKTLNGGVSWAEEQVMVGSTLIESHSHAYVITDADRHVIFYQDDDTFATIKWAYRTASSGAFTAGGTYSFGAGNQGWASPVPIKILHDGELRFSFYKKSTTTEIGGI